MRKESTFGSKRSKDVHICNYNEVDSITTFTHPLLPTCMNTLCLSKLGLYIQYVIYNTTSKLQKVKTVLGTSRSRMQQPNAGTTRASSG